MNKSVWEEGISEGVKKGLFGLGELKEDSPLCHYFKETPTISFSSNEVIIKEEICIRQYKKIESGIESTTIEVQQQDIISDIKEPAVVVEQGKVKNKIYLKFKIPKGKVSSIMGIINYLQTKFQSLEIELVATEGKISEQEFEDKIEEALRQLEIEVKNE